MPIRPENRGTSGSPNRHLGERAREARLNPGYDMAKCAYCGAEFAPYRLVNSRFCSTPCRKRSNRPSRKSSKQCPTCKASYTPEKSMKQAYCSSTCKAAARAARERDDPGRLAARRATQKAYNRTEAYRVAQRSAKARRRSAERSGSVTVAEWQELVGRFGNACAYCGEREAQLTMDHVVALAKGGSHSVENLVPACKSCNSAKGVRDWRDRVSCQ